MAFADNLPITESLGVFVGVTGLDWLTEGRAEPLNAALVALAVKFPSARLIDNTVLR